MCFVSMIYDHYKDKFPYVPPQPFPASQITQTVDLIELKQLIKEFREALQTAKKLDVLTKQPDCEDPEKAALELRVAALEIEIKALQAQSKQQ